MPLRVYIDGHIHERDDARISVFDRGFLYGDSVYEVFRTAGGRPVDLGRHLDRLGRSAERIYMNLPPRAEIEQAVAATLDAAANPDSYVRIVVTRGEGALGLDPALADRPRLIVMVKPMELPPAALYEGGADIAIVDCTTSVRVADAIVKSGNYLKNIIALADGRRRSAAYEVLLRMEDGRVVEGSTSNVFVVSAGKVRTPRIAEGLLDGITRQRVMELAAAEGHPIIETTLYSDDFAAPDEVFITSSVRSVLPIRSVDGHAVKAGAPGPITRKIMDAYSRFLAQVSAS